MLGKCLDGFPVEVVGEQAIVHLGEEALLEALRDANFDQGRPEDLVNVVAVAPPRRGGHAAQHWGIQFADGLLEHVGSDVVGLVHENEPEPGKSLQVS